MADRIRGKTTGENEMSDVAKLVILLAAVIALAIVGLFLMRFFWAWVVPDVFAGAVQQGIVPASISLWQALKLSLLFWAFALTRGHNSSSKK